ncbi:MAG: hypothetical protein M1820_006776 [Bogoriella megaspora]|nr:MAG: hypothetical protein M1820_006776 [Bogoriella megaspora]
MPRFMAPPPSGEFTVKLSKPFTGMRVEYVRRDFCLRVIHANSRCLATGTPTHTVEIIGEPNRSSSISLTQYNGSTASTKKSGDISKDDVQELMTLVNQLRGFPSSSSSDVYGVDTKLELNTFEIQWANDDDESNINTVEQEQKTTFKDVVDSIEALARQSAKDAAI